MELFLDCLPCLLRQVLEAARMASDDARTHEAVMDEAVQTLARHRDFASAPQMCEAMHAIVKRITGIEDPYGEVKARDISAALGLEPLIRGFTADRHERRHRALKASATGNVMDSALYTDLDLAACLMAELERPFAIDDAPAFEEDLEAARCVLILGDNAGEAVFDKVLAEELSVDRDVIFAVRGRAIINDVTVDDAGAAGIDAHATIVSTGCGAPGVVLESCSADFRALFDRADVVISKGQGNFEALYGTPRKVYFLLKAKCPKIATALGVAVNDYVFTARAGAA